MNAISRDKLKIIGPINFEFILNIHVQAMVNEHATMKIKAILNESVGKDALYQSFMGSELCLLCDFEQGYKSCFAGTITEANIIFENNTYFFIAVCISGSRQYDKQAHSRSFQDPEMTYKKLLRLVEGDTGNIVPIKSKDKKIEYPIIQYEETDWEFVKRLASRFNTVVIPEITGTYPQISFGVVDGKTYELDNSLSYELLKDIQSFRTKSKEHTCHLSDFVSYRIQSFGNYQLGDKVHFKGYNFVIMKKEMNLVHGILEISYVVGTEEAFGLRRYFNKKACGLTLEGRVLWTSGERVKVKLNIDQRQEVNTAYPFSYVPESGNIMYSMPEKGAHISIYLPESDESGAMAIGCRKPDDKFPNHHTKYMLTPFDKKLMVHPGKLAFSAKKRSARNTASLSDRLGVDFNTSKSIRMVADKSITFEAKDSYLAKAMVSVKMLQSNASMIEVSENNVVITAQKIFTSALTAPANTIYKDVKKVAMPDVSGSAGAVLGGITVGALDGAVAAALGAVPVSCAPSVKLDVSGIGKMFCEH